VLSPVMPLGPNRQKIRDQINAITACCNTRLYDTIDQQVKALAALSHDRHIKVVVVLTDGQDDASTLTRDQLINDIAASGPNAGDGIKVFTIAYGSDADVKDLQAIAGATGGQEYAGTPQNIQQVYLQISSFF
jgi:Ca-activated chloride channel homolog